MIFWIVFIGMREVLWDYSFVLGTLVVGPGLYTSVQLGWFRVCCQVIDFITDKLFGGAPGLNLLFLVLLRTGFYLASRC